MVRTAARTRKILRIVQQTPVSTQAELVRVLRRAGVDVTQATVSRDIQRLGLVKVRVNGTRYRYALPEGVPASAPDAERRLRNVFEEFARSVEVALDLVLVKTTRGGADPVAQAIDDMKWPDVAGTVAGEDTIILVPRRKSMTLGVASRLRKLLR